MLLSPPESKCLKKGRRFRFLGFLRLIDRDSLHNMFCNLCDNDDEGDL